MIAPPPQKETNMEEKIINGVLHKHTDLGWIPYTTEELTIMLQLERLNAKKQYHMGGRDACQKHLDKFKELMKKVNP